MLFINFGAFSQVWDEATKISGHGKEKGKRAKPMSVSSRAGMVFPVGRIKSLLCKGNFAERVGESAPSYLAAAN